MHAAAGFAVAAALHAGFQVTVTTLVYPAHASRPAAEWHAAHERHSRAITPLVAVVYATVLATGLWLVLDRPGVLGVAALAGTAVALAVTAGVAAPLHGRLTERDPALVRRLLLADRVRCAAAVLAAVLAVVALV